MEQDYHENTESRSAEDIAWIVITQVNACRVRDRCPKECECPQATVIYPDQGRQSETEGSMITRKRIPMAQRWRLNDWVCQSKICAVKRSYVKRKKTLQYSTQNSRQNGCNSSSAQTNPRVFALLLNQISQRKAIKRIPPLRRGYQKSIRPIHRVSGFCRQSCLGKGLL